ncbi:aminopeptidase P family protein [Gluconacetobacter asukensis]|uniref:Aminopeptidase P family protein n=1 Tax=Gluconacetobacter asukensis TaxID=1017181 RepID=A0A7W4P4C1_9PROT|nr:aminopeptidase P family protein [Gluconacetobacter asukensis]MBB2173610.1 aminopeptidase P family protein [Gluconacetobacter asukensis]
MTPAQRLEAFRGELARLGVDGFFLPRGDEYLGEYVPASAERLAFLTGFSGSAGFALVLPDEAIVFSDGRYQEQMRGQIDPAIWRIGHQYETPPGAWLARHAGDRRVGYDPRVTAGQDLAMFRAAGVTMVPLPRNPVDAIWRERPDEPAGVAETQPERLSGRSTASKIAEIAACLRAEGQDAVVLGDPTSVAWLLNLRGTDLPCLPIIRAQALLRADGQVILFVAPDRVSDEVRAHLGASVTVVPPGAMEGVLRACGGLVVRLDPQRVPVWFAEILSASGATLREGTDPCLRPRAIKTQAERIGMRQAHRLDGVALCRFLAWLDRHGIGETESAAAAHLLALRRASPECAGASFPSIVASGPNAAIMHYLPDGRADRRIEAGSFLLVDSGGQYRCGTTDVTRTVWVGAAPPPEAWRDQYTRVLKGLIRLSRAVFPAGTPGYRLDPLAREALWEVGLDFDHGAGHGLGSYLSVHEWPLGFTRRPVLDSIEAGMVLTNEPGYYAPGSHGMRLENAMETLLAVGGGDGAFCRFDTLTRAPIDRSALRVGLLDEGERRWLDAYHACVLDEIGPLLPPDDAAWLGAACRPI